MIKGKRVAAGIVTYNPEISRLRESVKSISEQVEWIYIYDNGSENIEKIKDIGKENKNVKMMCSDINIGIASALNRISESAMKEGIEWVLTLDHDSIAPKNIIKEFSGYLEWNQIGIICPVVYDRRRPEGLPIFENEYDFVQMCITSGSLVNLSVWEKIGKYDDGLFIGLVDDEYCLRNRINGYKILRVNSVVLDHELGNLKPARFAKAYKWIAKRTRCVLFNKLSYKREVSPLRLYYATRNMIFLNYKYSAYTGKEYKKKNYLYNGVSSIVRGKAKGKLLCAFIRGMVDGKKYIKNL